MTADEDDANNSGRHFVLAPGYMLDRDLWADVEAGLGMVGRLSYADLSKDSSIEAMAHRLLAEAPEQFVLIGFSMGGYVAREAARLAPERVTALVLIATSARGDSDLQSRRQGTLGKEAKTSPFSSLSRAAICSSLDPEHATEEVIGRIRAMGQRLGPEVLQRQSSLVRVSDLHRLGEITCPTLVIAAANDRLRTAAEAEELANGIPGSILQVIQGSGHMVPLERPELLSETITAWFTSD